MGDERTGRQSLRLQLTSHIADMSKRQEVFVADMEIRQRFLVRVAGGVLVALIVLIIVNALNLNKSSASPAPQQHEQQK